MKAYLNMFRNYVNFSGRTSGSEFWKIIFVNLLMYGIVLGISIAVDQGDGKS